MEEVEANVEVPEDNNFSQFKCTTMELRESYVPFHYYFYTDIYKTLLVSV